MSNPLRLAIAVATIAPALLSQSIVVPSGHDLTDASTVRAMPGIGLAERWQIVMDAPRLGSLIGRDIDAILLRRDFGESQSLDAASASLVVRMGTASVTSAAPGGSFSSNVANPVEVFRGTVNAPASPAVSGAVSWTPENVIRIALATPYVHASGGLVVEIETTAEQGVTWPIDAAQSAASGQLRYVGSTCGSLSSLQPSLAVAEPDLVLGRTSRFIATDEAGAPAWLLLGAGLRTVPLNLSVLGSVGCELWVDPLAGLPTTMFTSPDVPAGFGGVANFTVAWPADAALAGAEIGAQLLLLQSSGRFATTNAIGATLSAADSSFGMVMLSARPGAPIDVQSHAVPVIGFEVR